MVGCDLKWPESDGHSSLYVRRGYDLRPDRRSARRDLSGDGELALLMAPVVGPAKATEAGAVALVAIVIEVITALLGGILRDILGQEASIVMRREIYVTASAVGAMTLVAAQATSVPQLIAMSAGASIAFVIRGLAISLDWSLPVFRARAGRKTET